MRRVEHTGLQGGIASGLLYAALLGWLVASPPVGRPAARTAPTRIRLVAPPPAPTAPPEPPKPEPPQRPRRMDLGRDRAPPAPAPLLEPSPPATPQAAPRRFTVSMEATVPGGGVAVPVAGPGRAPAVRGVPGASAEGPSDQPFALEPDAGPSLLSQPSPEEMRSLYPEEARRASLEGDVRLEIVVSETGEVAEVRVVKAAGHGFDEAAQRLLRRFRFRPAVRSGRPAPAVIPWIYKFRLEG